MKIIHCADLHLDSAMTANLSGKKRRERRAEILHSFERMISYAEDHRVEAVLIAGDLFDSCHISQAAGETVRQAILRHPEILFYYLKGNHDMTDPLEFMEQIPANLKLFGEEWTGYSPGNSISHHGIRIWGAELTKKNRKTLFSEYPFDPQCFNIVMLHGQEAEYDGMEDAEVIPLRYLRNQGIDYLALGHIHSYKKERLDARGIYCYSGCLEGRGFDECGEHGFVLLTVDEKTHAFSHEFIPFSYRSFHRMDIDVTGVSNTREVLERIEMEWDRACYDEKSIIKIVLKGELDLSVTLHLDLLKKQMESWCFDLRIYDETTCRIDPEEYLLEESLKGEFVRKIMNTGLSRKEKEAVIRCGIRALNGEELF